jgi:hypothetical protein
MIICVGEEGSARLAEEGCSAAVFLRDDDLIEEEDRRVVGGFRFALVDELVECWGGLVGLL